MDKWDGEEEKAIKSALIVLENLGYFNRLAESEEQYCLNQLGQGTSQNDSELMQTVYRYQGGRRILSRIKYDTANIGDHRDAE